MKIQENRKYLQVEVRMRKQLGRRRGRTGKLGLSPRSMPSSVLLRWWVQVGPLLQTALQQLLLLDGKLPDVRVVC